MMSARVAVDEPGVGRHSIFTRDLIDGAVHMRNTRIGREMIFRYLPWSGRERYVASSTFEC